MRMHQENLYEYNKQTKILNGLILIAFLIFVIIISLSFYLYFNKLDLFQGTFIEAGVTYFKWQIANYTYIGVFMTAMIGALFFVPLPMEILFATFIIKNQNPYAVLGIYLLGLTIGYSLNLIMGYKFSNFSRNLISTKKFYQIKSKINKYGKYAVFLVNALPLPSQIVSFILGVFKYNKTKFYVQFWAGQGVKLIVIMGFVLLFK